jgi:predicted transcriptional regulator
LFEVRSPFEARRSVGRRSPVDLYATILEVVKRYGEDGRITRISYGAGMPVNRLRVFVDRLVALNLLRELDHDGWSTYSITHRGQEFLDTYWKMRGYIGLLEAELRTASGPGSGKARASEGQPAAGDSKRRPPR